MVNSDPRSPPPPPPNSMLSLCHGKIHFSISRTYIQYVRLLENLKQSLYHTYLYQFTYTFWVLTHFHSRFVYIYNPGMALYIDTNREFKISTIITSFLVFWGRIGDTTQQRTKKTDSHLN
jgi:hypothetical protein